MKVAGQIVVVTGGAQGIGQALCERFHREGARHVVAVDIHGAGAERTATSVGGTGFRCDVSNSADIARVIGDIETNIGPIGLFCSNAGIIRFEPDPLNIGSAPDDVWAQCLGVNVMAHVYAARALVPRMIARGGGYFLHTVSAAGLLSQLGSGVYATTKHAAIGFAENLAIAGRDRGVKVSVLCPQGVDTALLLAVPRGVPDMDGVLTPEAVADIVVEGLDAERFLILPHPEVATYTRRKSDDYDRWLGGMARLRGRM
jgi:NAD(P)-dependent dehydrogenase (short-subunit alcohol dehydrogenase family)